MAEPVTDLTTRVLERALDGTAVQQRVAASNLANLETPGYTARRVAFEDQLRTAVRAAERGDARDALGKVRREIRMSAAPPGPDGNNVSIEAEMTDLGEATLRYQILTRMIDRKLAMMGTAVGDGRSG